MKEKIRKECYRRVNSNIKNSIEFRLQNIDDKHFPIWALQDLRRIDTKIKKLLTYYKIHHPKSDKD